MVWFEIADNLNSRYVLRPIYASQVVSTSLRRLSEACVRRFSL